MLQHLPRYYDAWAITVPQEILFIRYHACLGTLSWAGLDGLAEETAGILGQRLVAQEIPESALKYCVHRQYLWGPAGTSTVAASWHKGSMNSDTHSLSNLTEMLTYAHIQTKSHLYCKLSQWGWLQKTLSSFVLKRCRKSGKPVWEKGPLSICMSKVEDHGKGRISKPGYGYSWQVTPQEIWNKLLLLSNTCTLPPTMEARDRGVWEASREMQVPREGIHTSS